MRIYDSGDESSAGGSSVGDREFRGLRHKYVGGWGNGGKSSLSLESSVSLSLTCMIFLTPSA